MARGFGSTRGSGTTDIIVTGLTAHSTNRSYHIWVYRNGDGGSSLGRIFDKTNGGTGGSNFLLNVDPNYRFGSARSVATGQWSFTRPSLSAWHGIGISYNAASDTNIPKAYVDGANVSVTEDTTPSGTETTSSDAYTIGNRQSDSGRNWDGDLAEFGIWDVILDAAEFAALGKGVSPLLIRPASLVLYVPMIRNNVDLKLGGAPTTTGTAVQTHPRVIYPIGTYYGKQTTAAGGSSFKAAWARNRNTVLYPGVRAA